VKVPAATDIPKHEISKPSVRGVPVEGVHYVGSVSMIVSLSDTGEICDITVAKGLDPKLDKEAITAIRDQLFQPIQLDGKPIPGSMMIFRDFFRGDNTDFLVAETAGAAPDEIPQSANAVDPPDVLALVSAGKIDGGTYSNSYFGLEFTDSDASMTAPALKDPKGSAVRLIDAIAGTPNRANMHSIGLIADRMSAHPSLSSPSNYVEHLSFTIKGADCKMVREEFPYIISGVQFTGAIFQEPDGSKPEPHHFRGIFSTPTKGYWLTLDITAASENQVLKLASSILFKAVQ
jgi:hypothetical protein